MRRMGEDGRGRWRKVGRCLRVRVEVEGGDGRVEVGGCG